MMIDPQSEFESWATSHIDDYPVARIGLRVGGEILSKKKLQMEQLVNDDDLRALSFTGSIDVDNRYRTTVESNSLSKLASRQYELPIADSDADDATVEMHLISQDKETFPELNQNLIDEVSVAFLVEAFNPATSQLTAPHTHRVSGLTSAREQIRQFLTMNVADWGLRSETGLLLTGPPGTGKTELVKSVCEELYGGLPTTIQGPQILSKWVGESEATLRRKFEDARRAETPVIYIDEIDAIGRARTTSDQDYVAHIVSQLLVLLDGIETKGEGDTSGDHSLKVIASTNAPSELDRALVRPGRLGDNHLEVKRPDEEARRAIFYHYLETIQHHADESSEFLKKTVDDPAAIPDRFVAATDDYTGADIEHVILTAARLAKRNSDSLSESHISDALKITEDTLPTESVEPPGKDSTE